MKWYRRAAEQEHAGARYYLGRAYVDGQGVKKDLVLAHMWLALAADQNYENAGGILKWLADQMTPAQIAEAERLAREWKQVVER